MRVLEDYFLTILQLTLHSGLLETRAPRTRPRLVPRDPRRGELELRGRGLPRVGHMTSRVCHFKLVLLGDTAVGKSCLVVRFVRDEFFEFQEPTTGGTVLLLRKFKQRVYSAAFLTQFVSLEGATVKFEIWDTAGQGKISI